jgi:hypothetical protein
MKKYGTTLEAFAKIRAKASRHAKNNPRRRPARARDEKPDAYDKLME